MSEVRKLIDQCPFPENGRELNKELIIKFKESTDEVERRDCIDGLIKLNMRCISLVKHRHAPDFEYDELLSMFHDVVTSSASGYNFEYDTNENSFLNYMIMKFRYKLTLARHEGSSIVRVPISHKESPLIVDIVEYADVIADSGSELDIVDDLDELIEKYSKQNLSSSARERLDLLKLSRQFSIKEISQMPELRNVKSDRHVNTRVHKCIKELIKFKKSTEALINNNVKLNVGRDV